MAQTFIDVHVLQNVPPSNLNRDDTGAPKSAVYGGVRRARVSSQAWKRATRALFKETLETHDLAVRTQHVFGELAQRAMKINPELAREAAVDGAQKVLSHLGIKPSAKRAKKGTTDEKQEVEFQKSEYLLFLSSGQLEHLGELTSRVASGETVKRTEVVEAASARKGVEVSLFGRMVADSREISVDAAVQVAHALSTHGVESEQDYFTAVDDLTPGDESGAGMLGTVEFNSATLYRYATLNISGLRDNLGDDEATQRAVRAFVESFCRSMPTGKQNTFANRTLPEAVVVMVRSSAPVSLVGAFEDAVRSTGHGWLQPSAEALASHARELAAAYGEEPHLTLVTTVGEKTASLSSLGEGVSFSVLLDRLRGPVTDALAAMRP